MVYPVRDTVNALRQLTAAKHIGKVVLEVGHPMGKSQDISSGRWVISGGLGALGALSGKFPLNAPALCMFCLRL